MLKVFLKYKFSTNSQTIISFIVEWVEAEDTYTLSSVNNIQDAVNTILKFLGLGAANSSEKVAEGTHSHTLLCSGKHITI